jgi:hypothetical protein
MRSASLYSRKQLFPSASIHPRSPACTASNARSPSLIAPPPPFPHGMCPSGFARRTAATATAAAAAAMQPLHRGGRTRYVLAGVGGGSLCLCWGGGGGRATWIMMHVPPCCTSPLCHERQDAIIAIISHYTVLMASMPRRRASPMLHQSSQCSTPSTSCFSARAALRRHTAATRS